MEHDANEMSSEAGSSGLESSEAQRAKAQAIALSQAADTARARYARLASPSAGLSNSNLHYGSQAGASDPAAAQGSRIGGMEAALAATTVVDQLQSSFPAVTANPIVKAGLPWAPLLLLKPAKRGSGVGAVVSDPRVWSAAAVAGLAIASEAMNRTKKTASIRITRFEREVDAGSMHKFLADALDDGGKGVPGQDITFTSSAPDIAEVDATGVVKAVKAGTATITATMDGKSDLVTIKVK